MENDLTYEEWLTEVMHHVGRPLFEWYRLCGFAFRDLFDDGELPEDAAYTAAEVCGRPDAKLPALRLATVNGASR